MFSASERHDPRPGPRPDVIWWCFCEASVSCRTVRLSKHSFVDGRQGHTRAWRFPLLRTLRFKAHTSLHGAFSHVSRLRPLPHCSDPTPSPRFMPFPSHQQWKIRDLIWKFQIPLAFCLWGGIWNQTKWDVNFTFVSLSGKREKTNRTNPLEQTASDLSH